MSELSASDEVLLAAANLATADPKREFTEWELTIEAWKLNRNRWGMRGFEEGHPDHKRVMNEIMGKGSIVSQGWLVRTRPNHYALTPAGLARASGLTAPYDTRLRSVHIYDEISRFVFHRVFDSYIMNQTEPTTWLGAAAFLGLTKNDPEVLETQLAAIRRAISDTLSFMSENTTETLRRGDAGRVISRERVERLARFVDVLSDRFRGQLDAIRRKGNQSQP
jgi:hypothetical protein